MPRLITLAYCILSCTAVIRPNKPDAETSEQQQQLEENGRPDERVTLLDELSSPITEMTGLSVLEIEEDCIDQHRVLKKKMLQRVP